MLNIDHLLEFLKNPDMPNVTYVSTEKKILSHIMKFGEIYSKNTARNKLDQFKKCMYYCSSDLCNPMFLSMAQDTLQQSVELLYIHELMFKFLNNDKHTFLSFQYLNTLNSKYESSHFLWKIPEIFMPFLSSYILAINASKKDFSTTLFFKQMNKYFSSQTDPNDSRVEEIYNDWTNEYLGRQYFCNLECIYNTYSQNDKQQDAIRSSVYSLTRMFIECPVRPSIVSIQLITLLGKFETNLKLHIYSHNNANKNLTILYAHDTPFQPQSEINLIKRLTNTFSSLSKETLTFIETSLDRTSKYKIYVEDYDSFKNKLDNHLEYIKFQIQKSLQDVKDTYYAIQHHLTNVDAVENSQLKIIPQNLDRHASFLENTISQYRRRLLKKLLSFSAKVQKASSTNPEKYNSLTVDTDNFEKLKDDIQYIENNLIKSNFQKAFKNLAPISSSHTLGYVHDNSYPTWYFYDRDILRIIFELEGSYLCFSEQYIISQFINNGFSFPMSRSDVINFLLNFDKITACLKTT